MSITKKTKLTRFKLQVIIEFKKLFLSALYA